MLFMVMFSSSVGYRFYGRATKRDCVAYNWEQREMVGVRSVDIARQLHPQSNHNPQLR
ncbi:MAG: hypothetical protein ABI298_06675 [Acidimicrobiales bacterium]